MLHRLLPPLSLLLLGTGLTACGGGGDADTAAPLLVGVRVVSPLLDDAGGLHAGDPAAVPADPAARAQRAHHATADQAAQLEAALGAQAIPVRVDCAADVAAAASLALAQAQGLQLEHHLDVEAPVLVRGCDPRVAARVADHLAAHGHTRVFVVAA